MKNKVVIINIYFGKLPDYFQLWLNSCQYNKEFNWIIFTDDETQYKYPSNVSKYICTLNDIKDKIIKKINLDIKVDNPYKLCDFKTIYGNIFEEYIQDFTHWGYCDLDMIFGDLSKYITDDILNKYDRVLNKGHLTIYKNNKKVNNYYILPYSGENYKYIFESKYHYGFDESAGLDKLYKENKLTQYIPKIPIIADINFSNYRFEVNGHENYKNQYFYFKNGKIFRKYLLENKEIENEFAYIHFQKRDIKVIGTIEKEFLISPLGILEKDKNKNLYKLNESDFIEQFKKKVRYKKIIIKQKIYRFLHWKLKI